MPYLKNSIRRVSLMCFVSLPGRQPLRPVPRLFRRQPRQGHQVDRSALRGGPGGGGTGPGTGPTRHPARDGAAAHQGAPARHRKLYDVGNRLLVAADTQGKTLSLKI